jgi:hypothetical protein
MRTKIEPPAQPLAHLSLFRILLPSVRSRPPSAAGMFLRETSRIRSTFVFADRDVAAATLSPLRPSAPPPLQSPS